MKVLDPAFNYLKSDFYCAIIREILNGCACELYMSSLIMSLCCIDYIGIPLSGNKKNTNIHFKLFLERYMADVNKKYVDPHIQEVIYAIRCSLVHSFGESDALEKINIIPEFEVGSDASDHLYEYKDSKGNSIIKISIFHFISEVIGGVEKFFKEVKDPIILSEWYKRLYIIGGFSSPLNKMITVPGGHIIHGKIHPLLEILDNTSVNVMEIAADIQKKLTEYYNNRGAP